MKNIILLFLLCVALPAFSQDPQKAVEYYKEAESAYKSGNLSRAKSKINDAIREMKGANIPVPATMTDLDANISSALRREEQRERERANRGQYDEAIRDAESAFRSQNYNSALSYAERALDLIPGGSEAQEVKRRIENALAASAADKKVAEAERYMEAGNKRAAFRLYKEAANLSKYAVNSGKLSGLESDLREYDRLAELARAAFYKSDNATVVLHLEKAARLMKLEDQEQELYSKAIYQDLMDMGDRALAQKKYQEAVEYYGKAEKNSPSTAKQRQANTSLKDASYLLYAELAKSATDRGEYALALSHLEAAQSNKSLNEAEIQLRKKVLDAQEEKMWTSADYSAYLKNYPSGKYSAQAKEKLTVKYTLEGDAYLKTHAYSSALSSYRTALNTASFTESAAISKKMNKTTRWADLGSHAKLDFGIQLPFGYSRSSMITRDRYAYGYQVSSPSGNSYITESDTGFTQHRNTSAVVPVEFDVRFDLPLLINGAPPILFFARAHYTQMRGFNLHDLEPLDYEVYTTIHEPTNQSITKMDTLNRGLYYNAYNFKKAGLNLGVRPLPFVLVYLPLQSVTFDAQLGAPCLECESEEFNLGGFGVGFGLELAFDVGIFKTSFFWENWNNNFNRTRSENETYNDKNAGSGVLSPNAFSRNLGFSVQADASEKIKMNFSFQNPVIRGKFTRSVGEIQEIRAFSQTLLTLKLIYSLDI